MELDLTEATEAIAEKLTGIEVGYPPFRTVWEYLGSHRSAEYRDKARELLDLAVPILERQIREKAREELRGPMRRLRSALVAVVDRLDVPYDPNVPEVTPWTRFVKPAVKQLGAAIARGDIAAMAETSGDDDA